MNDYNFIKGMMWGTALSIPLWMSVIGWVKILIWLTSFFRDLT